MQAGLARPASIAAWVRTVCRAVRPVSAAGSSSSRRRAQAVEIVATIAAAGAGRRRETVFAAVGAMAGCFSHGLNNNTFRGK
ncbi:hypothetical protein Bpla01_68260 [Burkholderia plantarii]|nr:hypothetical protein Bpla01_68260 [Burkholderia plantarii]